MTTDPYRQFCSSQYSSFVNNPINHIDVEGGWIPSVDEHGNIYVQAEEGDDATTLMSYFGGTNNARRYLPGFYFTHAFNDHYTITSETRVYFNTTNVYSQAMADAYRHPDKYKGFDETYNCHRASINGSQGKNMVDAGDMDGSERDQVIDDQYESVSPDQAIFGATLVTYGQGHTAVFFGRSKDGSTYLFTKNGQWASVPEIVPAKKLTMYGPEGDKGAETIGYGGVRDIYDNPQNEGNRKNSDGDGHILNSKGEYNSSGFYNLIYGKASSGSRGNGTVGGKSTENQTNTDNPNKNME